MGDTRTVQAPDMPLESTTGIATRDGLECDSISREPRFTWTKNTSSAGGLLRCP